MNILLLSLRQCNPIIGGVERMSGLLAKDWINHDNDVSCVTLLSSDDYKGSNIKHYSLPNSSVDAADSQENIAYLAHIISTLAIDVVVNQVSNISAVLKLCATVRSSCPHVKWITSMHYDIRALSKAIKSNFFISEKLGRSPLKWLKELVLYSHYRLKNKRAISQAEKLLVSDILRLSDRVVLLSKSDYPLLQANDKVVLIPNGIEIESQEIKDYAKKKQVLYVGRLELGQKRVDRLLRAWKMIEPKYPQWELVIVGHGDYGYLYERMVADMKLKRVKFTGFADPTQYYKDSAILALTSTSEGFGMVLIEAQKYGCVPVAFNNFNSAADIITDGVNGLLVKPFDEKAFAKALISLIDDKPRRERMAQNATDNVSRYDIKAVSNRWLDMMDVLLKE